MTSTLPTLDVTAAWSLLGEAVEHVEPLGNGSRARVYRVTLADETTRVVRLAPRGTGRLAREQWVRARLRGVAAVPVVPAVAVTRGSLALEAEVEVMPELPGRTMEAALVDAPDERAERLWFAFGEGLAAIHTVPAEGFGLLDGAGRGPSRRWRAVMEARAAEALAAARASPLVGRCDAAEARLAGWADALDVVHAPRLLHGDAQPGNVQVMGERVTAWMDFEFASGGDPSYELAFVGRFFEAAPWSPASASARMRRMEAFTRGYTARFATVGAAPERLAYYRLVHALRAAEMLTRPGAPEGAAAVLDARVVSAMDEG